MRAPFLLLAALLLAGCALRESARHAYGDGKRQLGLAEGGRRESPASSPDAICPDCGRQGCGR